MQERLYELKARYETAWVQMVEAAEIVAPEDYDVPHDPKELVRQDFEAFIDDVPVKEAKHEDFVSALGVIHHIAGMLVPLDLAIKEAEQNDLVDGSSPSGLPGLAEAFGAPTIEGSGFSATILSLDDLKNGDVDNETVARLEDLTGKSIEEIIAAMEAEREDDDDVDGDNPSMTSIEFEDVDEDGEDDE